MLLRDRGEEQAIAVRGRDAVLPVGAFGDVASGTRAGPNLVRRMADRHKAKKISNQRRCDVRRPEHGHTPLMSVPDHNNGR